jgi:transposase
MKMDALVKAVDASLEYEKTERVGNVMRIYAHSSRKEAVCPYCGVISSKVHSTYPRKFRDLPIQGNKVEIVIDNRKYFCMNSECKHTTFAEEFECLPKMGRRSKRLTEAIINTAINLSSITASKTLKEGTADVGKSTICRLLKKERLNRSDNRQEQSEKSMH